MTFRHGKIIQIANSKVLSRGARLYFESDMNSKQQLLALLDDVSHYKRLLIHLYIIFPLKEGL